ncbi:MAG: FRG domain-containing protein [Prevotellaceae bacterium]|nr:FRG domain-containing protein [Candidatus Faecinaster equi]
MQKEKKNKDVDKKLEINILPEREKGKMNMCKKQQKVIIDWSLLATYKTFDEKNKMFACSCVVDDQNILQDILSCLYQNENNFIYRGVSNASFKLFSSAQREWIINTNKQGTYENFVKTIIGRVKNNCNIRKYLKKYNRPNDDMQILTMLQHYAELSIMLDFSLSLTDALFFATDYQPRPPKTLLDQYITIYLIPTTCDRIKSTWQSIMTDGAFQINQIMSKYPNLSLSDQTKEDMTQSSICSYFRDNISMLSIGGFGMQPISINIPQANINTRISINNNRLIRQHGLFIANFTEDKPLEKVFFDLETPKQFDPSLGIDVPQPQDAKKCICCININKNLVPFIKSQYLGGVTVDQMYCRDNKESNHLENVMKNIVADLKVSSSN